MRKLKSILGILLILLSLAGLFFWEWRGRETVMTEQVLVAARDIPEGTTADGSMVTIKGIPKESLLEHVLTPGDIGLLKGKVTSQFIPRNGQIVTEYFRNKEFYLERNESIYVIDPAWISMRSSALRRGDMVDIYGSNGLGLLGTFRIAYVKDASEREVRNAGEESAGNTGKDILARTDSTSVIDHIEIISTFREYEKIVNRVSGADGTTQAALIIVQRGDQVDP